jgi:hypothetical protein
VLLGVSVNDDPTYAPVKGRHIEQQLVAVAVGARARFIDVPRLRAGVQLSTEGLWISSHPGLFNAGPARDTELAPALALDIPFTSPIGARWMVSIVPSFVFLPRDVLGAPFFGHGSRVAGRIDGRFGDAWSVFASGENGLGQGKNALRRDGGFDRLTTWWLGVAYRPTARVAVSASATNAAGGTAATRHLTQLGAPVTLYSLDLRYSPSVDEGLDARSADPASALDGAGGIGVPTAESLPPRHGRLSTTFDSEGALAVRLAWALGRRFQIEVATGRIVGPGTAAALDGDADAGATDIGDGFQYRFGPQIVFIDQTEGARFSLSGRTTVGRDFADQEGYLLIEAVVNRKLNSGVSFSLNPLAVQSGGRSLAAFGLGARVPVGDFAALSEWTASLSGERSTWGIGLRLPRRGRLLADVFVANVGGTLDLGRIVGDPRGARVGLTLNASL